MPAPKILAQSAISEGGEPFPAILSHIQILYLEVYNSVVSLCWAPACREFPLGYYGEGLRSGNLSINRFSILGAYVGIFDNLSPSTARMNNPSPNLTNVYLYTPPVGPTPDPL